MKDYLRCVVANRFCLLGIILVLCGLCNYRFGPVEDIKMFLSFMATEAGFMFLGATGFGVETFRAYRRTKNHIQRFGKVGDDFYYKSYCGKSGYKLAIKENTAVR